jgi:hypothetical protein
MLSARRSRRAAHPRVRRWVASLATLRPGLRCGGCTAQPTAAAVAVQSGPRRPAADPSASQVCFADRRPPRRTAAALSRQPVPWVGHPKVYRVTLWPSAGTKLLPCLLWWPCQVVPTAVAALLRLPAASLTRTRPPARSAHCALRVFECSCTCTPKSTTALQRRRSAPSAGSSSTPKRRCCVRQQVMLRYCLVAPAQRATEAGQLERQSRIRYRGRVGGLPWGYPRGRNRCAMPVCRSSASTCHVERRARRRTPDGAPRAQRQPSGGHLLVRECTRPSGAAVLRVPYCVPTYHDPLVEKRGPPLPVPMPARG